MYKVKIFQRLFNYNQSPKESPIDSATELEQTVNDFMEEHNAIEVKWLNTSAENGYLALICVITYKDI